MKFAWSVSMLASVLAGGLVSCGGGGGSTASAPVTPAARTTGFAVPTEVSPVSTGGAAPAGNASFSRALGGLLPAVAPGTGTDYGDAQTVRYVSEHAIDQFSIIETILNAISQTHYAEAENVGHGPYKSIVSWQEDRQGSPSKTMQTWVVDSKIIQEAGSDVNLVDCWIEDSGRVINAEFKIKASATRNSDGSYRDYGTWTLNVRFGNDPTQYFAARAFIGGFGETVLAIHENDQGGNNAINVSKAIMHKSATAGYGKVYYPDQVNNTTTQTTASYVYNAGQLLVHESVPQDVLTYKNRAASVDITSQYGLYDSVTGVDVLKTKSFGFPVSFSRNGQQQSAYYGANQGMHQLWTGDNSTIPDGTLVTRQDVGANVETYLTASYNGTLTRRTLVPGDISDLLNIPVQTFVNFQHHLTFDGVTWMENGSAFTDFASLASQPQKSVWINGPNGTQLTYDAIRHGFYPCTNDNGIMTPMPGGTVFTPASNDQLWINIGGSIYIEYLGAGSGWVEKRVTAFDQSTWTPTFDPNGDTPFTLVPGLEYAINNQGGNFIVKEPSGTPGVYDVQIELQAAANPNNLADVLGTVAYFVPQNYNPGTPSSFTFVTDAASADYLTLVYRSVGTQDANTSPAPVVGARVTRGQFNLAAYDAGDHQLPAQYNWNCPSNGNTYGAQTFLYNVTGQTRTYKLLDNPIQLAPLPLTVNGQSRTLSLQFDGWMHGLPDYLSDLAQASYVITPEISSKIINIPAGTPVADLQDAHKTYLIKPLQIGLYLPVAVNADHTLDITAANALDLSDPNVIPVFVDNGMGAEPQISVVKYSDGVKVQ